MEKRLELDNVEPENYSIPGSSATETSAIKPSWVRRTNKDRLSKEGVKYYKDKIERNFREI